MYKLFKFNFQIIRFTASAFLFASECIYIYIQNWGVGSSAYMKHVCFCICLTRCTLWSTTNNNEMSTVNINIRCREPNKGVGFAQLLHESNFVNVVFSEECSNNRALWLLLQAITLKATTESLTCSLWERTWNRWQKYSICMHLYVSPRKGRLGGRRRAIREGWKQNAHFFI